MRQGGDRVEDTGPGNDWRCVVTWTLPGASGVATLRSTSSIPARRPYIADGDGPKEVNATSLSAPRRGDAPNPLWQFDGLVDLLDKKRT